MDEDHIETPKIALPSAIVGSETEKEPQATSPLLKSGEPQEFENVVEESSGEATGIQLGASGAGQYAPSLVAGSVFMQPRPIGAGTQPVPVGSQTRESVEDPDAQKLREQRGARAEGWTAELAQRRAVEEAMSSSWFK